MPSKCACWSQGIANFVPIHAPWWVLIQLIAQRKRYEHAGQLSTLEAMSLHSKRQLVKTLLAQLNPKGVQSKLNCGLAGYQALWLGHDLSCFWPVSDETQQPGARWWTGVHVALLFLIELSL